MIFALFIFAKNLRADFNASFLKNSFIIHRNFCLELRAAHREMFKCEVAFSNSEKLKLFENLRKFYGTS